MVPKSLEDRMRMYESVSNHMLVRRCPVIVRIDGKSFSTFTRGFKRPFDLVLKKAMVKTTMALCKEMQGCVLGYTQSDEITLVLVDYKKLNSEAYFDYRMSKINSVGASTATVAFNQAFWEAVWEWATQACGITPEEWWVFVNTGEIPVRVYDYDVALLKKYRTRLGNARFDCRCFNMPREEVVNALLYRQQDAIRNSIESVGQTYFSASTLHKKKCEEIKAMLKAEKGIDWDAYDTYLQRGVAVVKKEIDGRHKWVADLEMPILKGEGREYVESLHYLLYSVQAYNL